MGFFILPQTTHSGILSQSTVQSLNRSLITPPPPGPRFRLPRRAGRREPPHLQPAVLAQCPAPDSYTRRRGPSCVPHTRSNACAFPTTARPCVCGGRLRHPPIAGPPRATPAPCPILRMTPGIRASCENSYVMT